MPTPNPAARRSDRDPVSRTRLSPAAGAGLVLTVLVLASAAFAVPAVRDAATLQSVSEARLTLSPGYLAIAPLSNVLDTVTIFSVPQHIALLVWAVLAFGVVRVWRGAPRERWPQRAAYELGYAALFLVALVVFYAMIAVMPRPMAELTVAPVYRPGLLTVDFHAHTRYSRDARRDWQPSDVRAWHRGSGFDAVYISDHRTLEGAERGIVDNPPEAGEGTMVLQALEALYHGEHVNILGMGRRYRGLTTPDLADVDDQTLALGSILLRSEPVLVETIPGDLRRMIPAHGPGTPGVRAIEVVDGSPRGLTQGRRERARIVHLADSLNLALVAGSDNHGWGRAAAGWTLVRIPGWRGMSGDSLDAAVETAVRRGGRNSTLVVERRVSDPGSNALEIAFAPPIAAWLMLSTLSADERVVWIVWIWAIVVAAAAVAARRRRLRQA